jgi:uncharacterized protein
MTKDRDFHLHDGKLGSAITVRVTPRSSRNEVTEILNDGTIKIRLIASMDDKQSNQVLVFFLAEILKISPSNIEIIAGQTGKDKLIAISTLDADTVQKRIISQIA